MKKQKKTLALLLAAAMLLACLSGCMMAETGFDFKEDGSVEVTDGLYFAESYFELIEMTPAEFFASLEEPVTDYVSLEYNGQKYYGVSRNTGFSSLEELNTYAENEEQVPWSLEAYTEKNKNVLKLNYSFSGDSAAYPDIDTSALAGIMQDEISASDQELPEDISGMVTLILNVSFPEGVKKVTGCKDYKIDGNSVSLNIPVTGSQNVSIEGYTGDLKPILKTEEIKDISITVSEPKAGRQIGSAKFKIEGDGVAMPDPAGDALVWYVADDLSDPSAWEKVSPETDFKSGKYYSFDLVLDVLPGFVPADDIRVSVNGAPSELLFSEKPASSKAVYASYTWGVDIKEGGETPVSLSAEIDLPLPGRTADPKAFKLSVSPAGAVNEESAVLTWYACSKDSENKADWVDVTGKVFEPGMYYFPDLFVSARPGFVFSSEAAPLVNGKAHDSRFGEFVNGKTGREAYLSVLFSPSDVSEPFDDVNETDPFYNAVVWAYNSKPQITEGTSANRFSPDGTCTRAQVVTFLWREAGCPEPETAENPFYDVKDSDYFYKPVLWAVENGITDGTGPNRFSPDSTCTYGHILTFIYRSAGEPGKTDASNGKFWYLDAMNWAKSEAITAADPDPESNCPRKDVITYLFAMDGSDN